jgi:hypothetical protein
MKQKFDSVEEAVRQVLLRLQKGTNSIDDTSTEWTRAIKNEIGRLGSSLGYEVYASSCDFAEDGEWLFDLTWADIDKDEYFRSIPLALESEWMPSQVIDDFCKLLVSRAEHRVMVLWASNKASADNKVKELIDEVDNSKMTRPGDRYLFACWVENEDKFYFQLHVAQ